MNDKAGIPASGEKLAQPAVKNDASGQALGIVSLLLDRPRLDELQLEPPLSNAETQELRKIQSGEPLDKILARLGVS